MKSQRPKTVFTDGTDAEATIPRPATPAQTQQTPQGDPLDHFLVDCGQLSRHKANQPTPTPAQASGTEHDCPKCGEHFSTCICPETPQTSRSPLPDAKRPWHNDPSTFGTLTDDSLKNVILRMDAHLAQVMSERDSLKANAQLLADELAGLLKAYMDIPDPAIGCHIAHRCDKAREALAQWEGSQK